MSDTAPSGPDEAGRGRRGADRAPADGHRLLTQLQGVLDDASSRLEACLQLVRLDRVDGVPEQRARVAVEPLDGLSREQYRQRLHALDDQVARAHAAGDAVAQAQALAEREALFVGLAHALGLRRGGLAPVRDDADAVDGEVGSPAG